MNVRGNILNKSITVLSPRSNFLRSPRLRIFHAMFFHGFAHRNGQWGSLGSRGVDASCERIEPPTVWFNRFMIPHYCYPSTWPVVSQEFHARLKDVPAIRFVPVRLGRVVNYPWSVEEPLHIEPGDQGHVDLFKSLPEVDSRDLKTRYEMLTFEHPSIISQFARCNTVRIEVGTQPLSNFIEYQYCVELFEQYPIHWLYGSLIFEGSEWEKVEDLIDAEFFNIRKVIIDL